MITVHCRRSVEFQRPSRTVQPVYSSTERPVLLSNGTRSSTEGVWSVQRYTLGLSPHDKVARLFGATTRHVRLRTKNANTYKNQTQHNRIHVSYRSIHIALQINITVQFIFTIQDVRSTKCVEFYDQKPFEETVTVPNLITLRRTLFLFEQDFIFSCSWIVDRKILISPFSL